MLKRLLLLLGLGLALLGPATPLLAKEAPSAAANPEVEKRMMVLAAELRCLVCQNQTIAESHAPLAVDLKAQVREQLAAGRSEDEVLRYMTARYGDFVLYKPPLKGSTALLWGGPALLLAGALGALAFTLRRRQRLPAEAFDSAPPGDEDEAR